MGLVICLAILIIFVLTNRKTAGYVPHEFGCGTDEVCYCDKAPDCGRKNG